MRAGHRAVIGALVAVSAFGAAQPANAQIFANDCMVTGGGQITAANGDQATLGGMADGERLVAHEVYIDHGPATELRFRSLTLNAMICDRDAHTAEFTGQGQVETAFGVDQLVQYRIRIFAPNNRGGLPDFYRITLSNGYDSGQQPVLRGNLVLHEG